MKTNILQKLPLWKKFAVAIFVYTTLLLVVTLSINYINSQINATKDLKTKANTMVELAGLASIDALWNFNTAALTSNGEALLQDNEICLVDISDADGKSMFQKSKDTKYTNNMILVEKEVQKEGKSIGRIKLGITQYFRQETLIKDLWMTFIFTTLFGFILGGIMTYLANGVIAVPINKIVALLATGADNTAAASNQLSATSQQLSQGSSEQASSIEETSSTLQETSSMLQQNNTNIKQATQLSEHTKDAAEKGNHQMVEMINAITEVKKSSDRIAKIIKIIDDIAFQTNILALNAAVEAARAGEAGMGFAVVAEEVRNLAQRSAQAANDTTSLIESNIELSATGVSVTERVKEALTEITTQAKKVSQLMDEIAAASQEQAQGLEQVNKAIVQVESVTQQNASNAEENAATSAELSNQAQNLRKIVQQLSELVNGETAQKMEQLTGIQSHHQPAHLLNAATSHSTQLGNRNPKIKVVSPEEVIPLDKNNQF